MNSTNEAASLVNLSNTEKTGNFAKGDVWQKLPKKAPGFIGDFNENGQEMAHVQKQGEVLLYTSSLA